MKDDVLPKKTPNESLSDSVIEKLIVDKLVTVKDKDAVRAALYSGKATPADWLQWIENKIDMDDKESGEINAD